AAFGTDRGRSEFPALLAELSKLEGDFWVRLLYIHPDNFPLEILSLIEEDRRILPYFDIPLQHASKQILASMGRVGDRDTYRRLFETIRSRLPDAVIRSTFLLGYPGEGRREREELGSFLQEVSCDWAGFFLYSREEGTRASELTSGLRNRITHRAAEKQKPSLETIQETITMERLSRHVGRVLPVLIEENVKGEELSLGRSYIQAPEVDGLVVVHGGNHRPGSIVSCRIIKVNGVDLEAVPIGEDVDGSSALP
ncbi:MAG TPA: radical SAM protein, partial [Spirochaetia bacterium]|nr:radical SAM protein [Spirochaetia bacterium]